MQYKEYILIYLTLISGLACTNTLHGIGIIIKRWKEITIDWVYFLASFFFFLTLVNYWFHSFHFPYERAKINIVVFFIFLTPSSALFFNTVIIFPRWTDRLYDYTKFFQENLKSHILVYGLFTASILLKIYITDFMLDVLAIPLLITLAACFFIYYANSIRVYKILITLLIFMHIINGIYQAPLW